MSTPQQKKPDVPELQELAPLIAAGDWDAVDTLLDDDYALKVEREKAYKGVLENENRKAALGAALCSAVDAWRPETVKRVLRLGDFAIPDLLGARQSALTQERYDVLRVIDAFAENIPEAIRDIFTEAFASQESPQVHPKLKADRLRNLQRNRRKGMKP